MKKTSVMQSMIMGMGIGFPVTLICMMAIGGFNPVIQELLTWAVASALYGLISYLLFRKEEAMGIAAILGLHCLCCAAITIGAVMICGYVQSLGQILVEILPVFAVVYLMIFAFLYGCAKWEEKKVNHALERSELKNSD